MFHSHIIENPVLSLIPDNVDNLIILDVAQGSGRWGFLIKTFKKGNPILVGIDIWPPYVEQLKRFNIYDSLIICDVRKIPIRSRLSHLVIACEILEHLTRNEGLEFIKDLERLYRKRLILSTPSGYLKSTNVLENPYQIHISGWTMKDLDEMGFKTLTIDGNKGPRSISLFIQFRAFILRRKINKALIAWKFRGLKDRPRQDGFI